MSRVIKTDLNLPRIEWSDLLWCWEVNRYDGMLEAIAFYNDHPVYIRCTDEFDYDDKGTVEDDGELILNTYDRIFTVYQLTDSDFMQLYRLNLLFKKHVGTHCEYDVMGGRIAEGKMREGGDHKLYPGWNNPFKYNLSQPIGWISRVKDVSKTIEEQEEGL